MNYKSSVIEAIGNTPLIELSNIENDYSLKARIFAKLERSNPTGSIKDRAAKEMILGALEKGQIKRNTLIIEPTSGNTGIGLACICASLSLRLAIYMPSSCSAERIKMMRALGAEVVLTPAEKGMAGAIAEANARSQKEKGSFIPSQFDNPDNSLAHYKTTGPEIYSALEGRVDIFVASFGTGGTLSGIARFLKERNPSLWAVGLEPATSPFVSEGKKGAHLIQGIGAGFKPRVLEMKYVDEILRVSDGEAYARTRELARKEGLLVGISSGCNLAGALSLASREENKGKNIVTVFPDNGERYLSVEGLYD